MPSHIAKYIAVIILAVALPTMAHAQWRRVVTYQSVTAGKVINLQAYTFDSVDDQPHFPGGDGAMMKFINRERQYPHQAYAAGIEGRVLLSFIVNADGSISHAEVIRGVEQSLNDEALRIIGRMPRWVAGKIGETSVPVYCIMAIPFRI